MSVSFHRVATVLVGMALTLPVTVRAQQQPRTVEAAKAALRSAFTKPGASLFGHDEITDSADFKRNKVLCRGVHNEICQMTDDRPRFRIIAIPVEGDSVGKPLQHDRIVLRLVIYRNVPGGPDGHPVMDQTAHSFLYALESGMWVRKKTLTTQAH